MFRKKTAQARLKAKLEAVRIPYKSIDVYDHQVVITTRARDTADRWAALIGQFCGRVRVVKAMDYAKINRGTTLNPTMVDVWRVGGTIDPTT